MAPIFTRTRILIGAVVILAVTNLSTLGSIWYHMRMMRPERPEFRGQGPEAATEHFSGRFFKEKLKLTNSQLDTFKIINGNYRHDASELTKGLSEYRNQIMTELDKPIADTTKLYMLSARVGNNHTQLKIITYKYYLSIKGICNPEQQLVLKELFQKIFINDGRIFFPGHEGRHGPRGERWHDPERIEKRDMQDMKHPK